MQFFKREISEGFEENRIEPLTQRFTTHFNKYTKSLKTAVSQKS